MALFRTYVFHFQISNYILSFIVFKSICLLLIFELNYPLNSKLPRTANWYRLTRGQAWTHCILYLNLKQVERTHYLSWISSQIVLSFNLALHFLGGALLTIVVEPHRFKLKFKLLIFKKSNQGSNFEKAFKLTTVKKSFPSCGHKNEANN